MSGVAVLPMVGIGLIAIAIGAGLLLTAPRRRAPPARYVSRLAGTMFCAVGLILIVFAGSWTLAY